MGKHFFLFFEGEVETLMQTPQEVSSLEEADKTIREIFTKLDKAVHIVPTAETSDARGWILSVNEG
jgi:hypothetical protein